MICAPPSRDHSARMVRTGTLSACSVTRPPLICSRSGAGACACASAAHPRTRTASPALRNFMGTFIVRCRRLIRPHVFDDRPDDVVELHLRLIAHKFTDFRNIGPPAGHVLEP